MKISGETTGKNWQELSKSWSKVAKCYKKDAKVVKWYKRGTKGC